MRDCLIEKYTIQLFSLVLILQIVVIIKRFYSDEIFCDCQYHTSREK